MTVPMLTQHVYRVPRPGRLYRTLKSWLRPKAINLDTAYAVLANYDLQIAGKPENLGGKRSANLLLKTSDGKKMLKRYKNTVELGAVLCEHSILNHLAAIDFPAPRLTPTASGESVVQQKNKYYALFDILEGYFQYYNYVLLPGQMRHFISIAGEALGNLHVTLADFTPGGQHPLGFSAPGGERRRELGWFIDKLTWCREQLAATPVAEDKARLILQDADWVETRLYELDDLLRAAALPTTVIHGDYGPYNLFFRSNGPVVILDFELARLDWRLTDLASALPTFAKSRRGPRPQNMRAFLDGYRSRCPIDREELALLPTVRQFLLLRRVIVCWQRYCLTHSEHWLNEARNKLTQARWMETNRQVFLSWLTDM